MSFHDYERRGRIVAATPDRLVLCTVRGFGYDVEHLALLPAAQLVPLQGAPLPGWGAATPVAALCGNRVRSAQPFVHVSIEDEEHYRPPRRVADLPPVPWDGRLCVHCERALERAAAAGSRDGLS